MSTPPEAEPQDLTTDQNAAPPRFPWPPGESEPVVDGFVETWRSAVFAPASFFRALPASLSLGPALLYYLIIGITGAAVRLFWSMLLPQPESSLLTDLFGSALRASPLIDFLASPLYLLLSLFLATGVTHLFVLLLAPAHRGFGMTLRVFCFAYSPVLFAVVPYAGSVVAFVWMTVLSIVGVRAAHHTTTGRAAAAVLLPLAVALLFIAAAYTLLARASVLLGG